MSDEPAEDVTAAPAIVMVANGFAPASLVLSSSAELGRKITASGATHEVADERMSRDHAKVRWERGTWLIDDLDSRNGTFINGERIAGQVRRRGDVIVRLGHTVFVLLADGRGQPATDGDPVIGPELSRVLDQIKRHARSGATLLVQGEPGSGKQLAARVFHREGPRAAGPFVMVSCNSIHGVADRLLFGGKKGVIETIGHFQMAHGGTLYLAGIADLDLNAQAALSRLLDVREASSDPPDVGIVCGGNQLRLAAADARLREDLFQRLSQVTVHLPPLRARRVDLVRIVQHEVAKVAAERHHTLGTHPKVIEACALRPWPGNVADLRAAVRQAALTAIDHKHDVVRIEDLLDTAGLQSGASSRETAVERKSTLPGEINKGGLIDAMQRANGALAVAARALGIHRNQLVKLLDEHGIAHED